MKLLKKWDFISSDNKIGIYKELAHLSGDGLYEGLDWLVKALKTTNK